MWSLLPRTILAACILDIFALSVFYLTSPCVTILANLDLQTVQHNSKHIKTACDCVSCMKAEHVGLSRWLYRQQTCEWRHVSIHHPNQPADASHIRNQGFYRAGVRNIYRGDWIHHFFKFPFSKSCARSSFNIAMTQSSMSKTWFTYWRWWSYLAI